MILAITTATFLNKIKHGFGSYETARFPGYTALLVTRWEYTETCTDFAERCR